jgi:hypothetical protein
VELESPPVRVVFVVSAQRAWTTHESLWVLVGFGHFEKSLHASNVLRGSSVNIHPLPIHLHHINSNFYQWKVNKEKDEEGWIRWCILLWTGWWELEAYVYSSLTCWSSQHNTWIHKCVWSRGSKARSWLVFRFGTCDTMTYRGHLMAILISIISYHTFYKLTSIKLAKCKIKISSMFHYIKK